MSDPKHPQPGDLSIDATDVTPAPVDGQKTKQLIKLRQGYDVALTTLAAQPQAMLTRAGIDINELNAATAASANITRIAQLLPAAKALYLLLNETYLVNRNQVAAMLGDAGASAKRRAARDPKGYEILAALGPVLDYNGAPAKKAVATKIKEGKLKPKAAKSKATTSTTTAAQPAATAAAAKPSS